jgi:uncharacterized protein YjbJ (UPF0337 family)
MKALPWIIAGMGVGVGLTLVMLNEQVGPQPEYATGSDSVERAARKTFGWGTKRRAEGKAGSVVGAIKEGIGRVTGNDQMTNEGAADRVVGNVKDAAGQLGNAVGETIHDLNR